MSKLNYYLYFKTIHSELKSRTKRYFEYYHEQLKKSAKQDELFSYLSHSLKNEISKPFIAVELNNIRVLSNWGLI
jgi:hypothetical protein